jgi:Ankyrin repeats (3 copies)
MIAVSKGDMSCTKQLLSHNPTKITNSKSGETILHQATKLKDNSEEMVRILIDGILNKKPLFTEGKCGKKPQDYTTNKQLIEYLNSIEASFINVMHLPESRANR